MKLTLNHAQDVRLQLTEKQQKAVTSMYEKLHKQIKKDLKALKGRQGATAGLRRLQLSSLQRNLYKVLEENRKELAEMTQANMQAAASAVVQSNIDFLDKAGIVIQGDFSHVPDQVVKSIVKGSVYSEKWSLTSAIWGNNNKVKYDIRKVCAQGAAMNQSAYDIAKNLEKYVQPGAAKPSRRIYEVDENGKRTGRSYFFGKVDYNAQRLARTLVSHAYQQAITITAKANPFCTGIEWLASNSWRKCPICASRDGKVYKPEDLPLDHPNGMCTFVEVLSNTLDEIADRMIDWASGKPDPAIDAYMEMLTGQKLEKSFNSGQDKWLTPLGYTPDKMPGTFKEFASKLTASGLAELLTAAGSDWSDPHPYQAMEKYYNKNLLNVQHKLVKSVKKKVTGVAAQLSSAAADLSKWVDHMKQQTEQMMLDMENITLAQVGDKGKQGIITYSGNSYTTMNKYLRLIAAGQTEEQARQNSHISDRLLKEIDKARDGLNKAELPQALYLRRGTDVGDLAGLLSGDFAANKQRLSMMSAAELNAEFQGYVGRMSSFTSTSSIYERGFPGNVEVIMYAPEGTHASSIMSISRYGTSEGETMLNVDTPVRVLKIEESDGHMYSNIRVFMEILKSNK